MVRFATLYFDYCDVTVRKIRVVQHGFLSLCHNFHGFPLKLLNPQAIYKAIHITKLNQLVESYNANHSPFQLQQKDKQEETPTSPPTKKQTSEETDLDLLSYQDIAEKLEECATMIGPTWPSMTKHPPLLAKKQTKEVSKQLRNYFAMFETLKGKMLPTERRAFVRKKTDKQVKSNQIYNLYNNFSPLQYFL